MGVATINPAEYGKLCADVLPKVIETAEEFDRMVERMEAIDFNPDSTPEERVLSQLLARLVRDYDDTHYPDPEIAPHEMIQYLMEQRGLKQADLVELIGSRAQVSDMVTGKRAVSKAQAKKLAEFFHTKLELFI